MSPFRREGLAGALAWSAPGAAVAAVAIAVAPAYWYAPAAMLAVLVATVFWVRKRAAQAAIAAAHQGERDRLADRGERERLARRGDSAEAALAALPEAVLRIDRSGTVLDGNDAARQWLGADPRGRDLAGLLRDSTLIEALSAVLAGRGAREAEFVMAGEAEREIKALLLPLPGQGPGEAAALVVLQDASAVKRLDRIRADFVANVSHELKTPLASLIGFIETLRGPASNDAAARERFLEIMHQQATRMGRLVADIMSLSRLEIEEARPPTENVAIVPVLRAVTESLQTQAARRRIALAVDLGGARPDSYIVVGERDHLHQVFQNLVDNAIKYGREGSPVRIALAHRLAEKLPPPRDPRQAKPEAAVEIAVIDQGDGIAPEHLNRLTERFYRIDRGRSRALGGTGLGLAIVKHILQRHGGWLGIESRLGEGSRFAVHLPAAGSKAPAKAPQA